MSFRWRIVAIVLLVSTGTALWPQSTPAVEADASNPVSVLPEPYAKEEFPPWAHGVRRFEIISLGAFPILLFYTRLAYDTSLFVKSGFDSSFAPWPFRNENSYTPTNDEQVARVLTAAGLSLVLGTIDAIIINRKQGKKSW